MIDNAHYTDAEHTIITALINGKRVGGIRAGEDQSGRWFAEAVAGGVSDFVAEVIPVAHLRQRQITKAMPMHEQVEALREHITGRPEKLEALEAIVAQAKRDHSA